VSALLTHTRRACGIVGCVGSASWRICRAPDPFYIGKLLCDECAKAPEWHLDSVSLMPFGEKLDGFALAGCADRAGVVVILKPPSLEFMKPEDWERFAFEVRKFIEESKR
jgi:hypothetical protein